MPGAMEGIRVLEFSEMIAAPLAGMLLGDLGADVIKVEPPGGESWRLMAQFAPGESRSFIALNRNKRGIALDLKTPEGQAVVHRLVPTVDVVIVNYRPDTAATLKIDYETLSPLNDRLIYADNTAVGRRGPSSHRPGYDLIVQAMSGLMVTGGRVENGIPIPLNPPVIDLATGITIAWAICAALFARERDGAGQQVETTLLATSLLMQGTGFLRGDFGPARVRPKVDGAARLVNPYYCTYRTSDGMVSIAALTPIMRRRFEEAVGVEHQLHGRRDVARDSPEAAVMSRQFLADVATTMAQRTTREWLAVFDRATVPAGPCQSVDQLADDPQVLANELVADLEHPVAGAISMVGPVVRMSGTPATPARLTHHRAAQRRDPRPGRVLRDRDRRPPLERRALSLRSRRPGKVTEIDGVSNLDEEEAVPPPARSLAPRDRRDRRNPGDRPRRPVNRLPAHRSLLPRRWRRGGRGHRLSNGTAGTRRGPLLRLANSSDIKAASRGRPRGGRQTNGGCRCLSS
ncbi:MAG TPA: CoA transferase [Acidimicrobiales bacterium]|nr:CoA transferase [Acidimicrobiales bacterium]